MNRCICIKGAHQVAPFDGTYTAGPKKHLCSDSRNSSSVSKFKVEILIIRKVGIQVYKDSGSRNRPPLLLQLRHHVRTPRVTDKKYWENQHQGPINIE